MSYRYIPGCGFSQLCTLLPSQILAGYDNDAFGFVHGFAPGRKRKKATHACDMCRARKRACDEGRPCIDCQTANVTCKYSAKRHRTSKKALSIQLDEVATELDMQARALEEHEARLEFLRMRVDATKSRETNTESDDTSQRQAERKNDEIEHRAGVHNLVHDWPTVHNRLQEAKVWIDPDYVMVAESNEADLSRAVLQGQRHVISLSGHFEHDPLSISHHYGLDIQQAYADKARVWTGSNDDRPEVFMQKFVEHIWPLHPALDLERVELLFYRLMFNPDTLNQTVLDDCEMSDVSVPEHAAKRRRFDEQQGEANKYIFAQPLSVQNTLETALIYLILAIGQMCAYRVSPPHEYTRYATDTGATEAQSQIVQLSPSSSNSSVASPMAGQKRRSVRTSRVRQKRERSARSTQGSSARHVPGMTYYNRAKRTMGIYMGGNALINAQLAVLAAIYNAQLGRVQKSMNWIFIASRATQYLLKTCDLLEDRCMSIDGDTYQSMRRSQSRMKTREHILIVLTAWTCIQLESDIMAELNFAPSGILAYADLIPWPSRIIGAESYRRLLSRDAAQNRRLTTNNILLSYTARLWLRKRQNDIQKHLYGDACVKLSTAEFRELLLEHQQAIESWRNTLPKDFEWERNPPARESFMVDLQARYWSTCALINRPFLDSILHLSPMKRQENDACFVALDANGMVREEGQLHLLRTIGTMSERKILDSANRCIEAATQSVKLFNDIPYELISTNVFGLTHGQFGNAIILAAAHANPLLDAKITTTDLETVICRTIQFLERQSFASRTSTTDCALLRHLLPVAAMWNDDATVNTIPRKREEH